MAPELVVLGSSGGYPGPGRAASGYLVRDGEHSLVMDLGSGTLANLQRYVRPDALDGLVLTHMHYDHYVDIYGLCTARRFWKSDLPALPLLAPAVAPDVIASPLTGDTAPFMQCLAPITAEDGETYQLGAFEITAAAARHGVMEAYAYRVTVAGRSLCYTGDTDASPAVVDLARGTDLLVCESTFTSEVEQKIHGHLYAAEAGQLAADAGVGRLLVTHVWPTLDEERAAADARERFTGEVLTAREGLVILL